MPAFFTTRGVIVTKSITKSTYFKRKFNEELDVDTCICVFANLLKNDFLIIRIFIDAFL